MMAMAQHARTKRSIRCTENSATLLTWHVALLTWRAPAWRMSRAGSGCAAAAAACLFGSSSSRTWTSLKILSRLRTCGRMPCERDVHTRACWQSFHLKGADGFRRRARQVVCNWAGDSRSQDSRHARGLSRTRAGAVESSRCGDAQRHAEFCVEF